jgi:hypothetical protein
MNYIEDTELEQLNSSLRKRQVGVYILRNQILQYSTKDDSEGSPPLLGMDVDQRKSSKDIEMELDGQQLKSAFTFAPDAAMTGELLVAGAGTSSGSSRIRSGSMGADSSSIIARRRSKSRSGSMSSEYPALADDLVHLLVRTLNSVFDGTYDFTGTPPSQFRETTCDVAMNFVNQRLSELEASGDPCDHLLLQRMWNALNGAMDINKCEWYEFKPLSDITPIGSAAWSFHYILRNEEKDKICYFGCMAMLSCSFRRSGESFAGFSDSEDDDHMSAESGSTPNATNDSVDEDTYPMGLAVSDSEDSFEGMGM